MTDNSECNPTDKIGSIINKCPNCNFKNITYSISCDSCDFSWERYCKQEGLIK
jgi:hypothetical protein